MSVFTLCFPLVWGITLWMVNGSPTSKLTAEYSDSPTNREAKQILLPMHFPGQFQDFHDYIVPSIQSPAYVFYNDKVHQNQYQNGIPVNAYPQHYGFYPYHAMPATPGGKIGLAVLFNFLQSLFGNPSSSSSSSSSSSTTDSSSSSGTTDSSSSSSATTDSSSSSSATTDSSSSSSATTDSSSSSSATTDSSSSSSATTDSSSSSSATTDSSLSSRLHFIPTRIHITRTPVIIPMAAIVIPTRRF